MLQLGFFIFMNLLAFGFLFYGLKGKKDTLGNAIFLFSMVLFFILGFSVLLDEQEGIGATTNYVDNFGMNITQTDFFVEPDQVIYLVYIYWGMAILTFLGFMLARWIK